MDVYIHDLHLSLLFGALDKCFESEILAELILLQGVMGQQEAIVQHIKRLKKGRVNLHLTQKPKALLICHVQQKDFVLSPLTL